MIFLYNVGDWIGKILGSISFLLKMTYSYSTIIIRFGFFFIFLLIASTSFENSTVKSDAFCIFNMLLFAITNGYTTTVCMTLAPTRTQSTRKKELIGFINATSLIFGISVGTFIALAFQTCKDWKWK